MAGVLRIPGRPPSGVLPPSAAAAGPFDWRLMVTLAALPMFAQCFQYLVDVPPLYALSKAWPFLTLPLFVWGLLRLDLPFKLLQIVTLVWIVGITPIIGIAQLGNDFPAALATTVKVWPFTFSFALAGLLVLLRVPASTLRRIVVSLGVATYAIMVVLWAVAPTRWYGGGDTVSKLFMYHQERGYHLYMPMFFGILLVFVLNRSFWSQPRVWKAVAIAVCFALMLHIYKQRAAIAGAGCVVLLGAALSNRRWRGPAVSLLTLAACLGIAVLAARAHYATGLRELGGSLSVRQVTVGTAWNYLTADPARWLLGVGATTRFGDVQLTQIFGNRHFFLTDVGWLGVAFEYGTIGALLILLVHLAGLAAAARWSRPADALSQACADYIIYLLVVSSVYSVVFTPGELTTVMALSYYLASERRAAAASYGGAALHPDNARPRHIALASPRPFGSVSLPAPSGSASNG